MDEEDYVEPCSICLEDLIPENKENAENLGILSCNHKFHEACIKLWSEKACTCPIDRSEFNEIKIYNCREEYLSTFSIKSKNKEAEIEIEDLSFCIICGSSEHEEIMLLCDICDAPYHTTCLGLNSIPIGNWYCPNCVNENPALASSMFQDDEYVYDYSDSPLIFETVSFIQESPIAGRRTRNSNNEGTKKKYTRKTRGKKVTSRTVANSNTRIKAPRSMISKLRKEIIKRRQDNMIANQRLLAENVLLDIPYSFSDYVDAYRASSSNSKSTRNLGSLREKLNYDMKKKHSKMLDTKTVNEIYNKPSSYNRKSEYDMIWRQASIAKKFNKGSDSSPPKNNTQEKKDLPSTSFKRPNIAQRKMKEPESTKIDNKTSLYTNTLSKDSNYQLSSASSSSYTKKYNDQDNNNNMRTKANNTNSRLNYNKSKSLAYSSNDKASSSNDFKFNSTNKSSSHKSKYDNNNNNNNGSSSNSSSSSSSNNNDNNNKMLHNNKRCNYDNDGHSQSNFKYKSNYDRISYDGGDDLKYKNVDKSIYNDSKYKNKDSYDDLKYKSYKKSSYDDSKYKSYGKDPYYDDSKYKNYDKDPYNNMKYKNYDKNSKDGSKYRDYDKDLYDDSKYKNYDKNSYDDSKYRNYRKSSYDDSKYKNKDSYDDLKYKSYDKDSYNDLKYKSYNKASYDDLKYKSYNKASYDDSKYKSYDKDSYDNSRYKSYNKDSYDDLKYKSYDKDLYDDSKYRNYNKNSYDDIKYNSYNKGSYDGSKYNKDRGVSSNDILYKNSDKASYNDLRDSKNKDKDNIKSLYSPNNDQYSYSEMNNKGRSSVERPKLHNIYSRFSSNNNLSSSNYRSSASTEDLTLNNNKYQISPQTNTDLHYNDLNQSSSSSINRILFNNPGEDTVKENNSSNGSDYQSSGRIASRYSNTNRYHPYKKLSNEHPPIDRSTLTINDHPLVNSKVISKSDSEPSKIKESNKEFSSREVLRYLKPYLKKKVNTNYISKDQYKKLTKDLTYYVIKRMSKDYSGDHKMSFNELKEDFLIEQQFTNKIIINFINYNLRKFLAYNKELHKKF